MLIKLTIHINQIILIYIFFLSGLFSSFSFSFPFPFSVPLFSCSGAPAHCQPQGDLARQDDTLGRQDEARPQVFGTKHNHLTSKWLMSGNTRVNWSLCFRSRVYAGVPGQAAIDVQAVGPAVQLLYQKGSGKRVQLRGRRSLGVGQWRKEWISVSTPASSAGEKVFGLCGRRAQVCDPSMN